MGQCIGNCVKCTLVPDEEKVTCCTFQTLKQTIEIRTQLKSIVEKIEDLSISQPLSEGLSDILNAEPPAAEEPQERTPKKSKK